MVSRVVAVGGGYSSTPQTVPSKQILSEGRVIDFIRVNKNDNWLLKISGGRGCQKGGLRRTRVLEELRKKLKDPTQEDCGAKDSDGSAVADQADPMLGLQDLGETEDHAAKRRKTLNTPCSDKVKTVLMPASFRKPQLRPVRALEFGRALWVHEDDVGWLVTYLAEEVATGGVGPIDDADGSGDDERAGADEAPFGDGAAVAVPSGGDPVTPIKAQRGEVKLRWDFDGAWEGVITKGPHKGTTVSCKVANLTPQKWAAAAQVHKYDVDFERATYQEKKTAARHYLELHLQGCRA